MWIFRDCRHPGARYGNDVFFVRYVPSRFVAVNIIQGHRHIDAHFEERGEP